MTSKHPQESAPLGGQNAPAKKLKTWLAKTVIRHPDPAGGASWVDHEEYYPIEAENAKQARHLAMRAHCPDAYEGNGKWGYMHFGQEKPVLRAFYLSDESAVVDVGCGYAIVWVKPVPAEEYSILKKWLCR